MDHRVRLLGGLAIGMVVGCSTTKTETKAAEGGKVSEFGRYEGYSPELYSEWVRESHYVTMRDGVKLAVDIIRPAKNGVAVDQKFPVLWTHSRYHRTPPVRAAMTASHDLSAVRKGHQPRLGPAPDSAAKGVAVDSAPKGKPKVVSVVDGNRALQRLLKHGYVVVSVGVRGSDVSYGRYQGLFSPAETKDAYDVMEWMTKQPWCDGNLGMFGGSYLGITQYMAASTKHPALKAIFPTVALFDVYDVLYAGGIYRENMIQHWGILTRNLDVNYVSPPVDEDEDGRLAKAALAQHEDNWNVIDEFRNARTRDYNAPSYNFQQFSPSNFLADMNASGVAAYHSGGWYDVFAKDELLWLANWKGRDRLMMGPWSHAFPDSVMGAERARIESVEEHRWFDRWLKNIANGVDTEQAVRYAVMDDPGKWTWKASATWPPTGVENASYYFAAGKSGSVASANDGLLAPASPADAGKDGYKVDLTTTTGTASRWDNAVGQGPMNYPDMAPNDAKSLTYTTAPLAADVTVTGSPIVTLYVASDQPDGDFHALLEEVDPDGRSHYISEGMLRASDRVVAQPAWDNLGLPWHRGAKADATPLVKGQVAELKFDLQPTATVFNAGHRIRVTVMGADTDNTEAPPVRGRPTIQLYRGGDHASNVVLPISH